MGPQPEGFGPSPGPAPQASLTLGIADAAGLASVMSTGAADVLRAPRSPVVLMHGAIQGGWVWNFSQPEAGAPLVTHQLAVKTA